MTTSAMISLGASAAPAQQPAERWQWSFTPYTWFAGTNGRIGTPTTVGDINRTFGEVMESLNVGFTGVLEARRGSWAGRVDVSYINTSDNGTAELSPGVMTSLGVDQEQTMIAPEAVKTVHRWSSGTLDFLAGLRYWHVEATVGATDPTGTTSASTLSASTQTDWADLVGGAQVRLAPWSPRWHLVARFDLGGGGSDATWQAVAGVAFDLARWCSIGANYRHLDVDYESGTLVNDVVMSGPAFSLQFRF